jgi:nucleoside-diphosphate-sugar epimerase
MKVLITGGGGFIGSHLIDSQLAQGHKVHSLDLHHTWHTADHPLLQLTNASLTDTTILSDVVAGVDIVYHLASAHLDVTLADDDYRAVNVEATLNLLRAAQAAGVKRFVHCSTNGVIGDMKNPPVDETAMCYPTNIYERTKLEGECVAMQFYRETGLPVVVVRPSWVYGPRCPRTVKLLRSIKKRRFPLFGDGQTLRHPIYITDFVRGIELCATVAAAVGQIYFLAGETAVSIKELIQTAAEVQGVRPLPLQLPLLLGYLAGYGLQLAFLPFGKQPPFSRRSLDFYLKNNAYNITKARQQLGFQPQIDLPTGLRETLQQPEKLFAWQIS